MSNMHDKQIKVLVLGIGQSNFLNALYGEILKRDASFNFDIDVLNHLPNDEHNECATVFSESLHLKNYLETLTSAKKNWIFFKECTRYFFLEVFLFELSQKKSVTKALRTCKELALKKNIYHRYIAPKKYDVLHFHFCTRSNLEYLHFIGSETKVICSYWGSDLWRTSNIRNNYFVSKALQNATFITLQTPEMGLALKAKHGIHLDCKLRYLRFTMNTATCDAINMYRNDQTALKAFKHKYNLPEDKIIVAIGHNAFQENNHVEIIKALNLLPDGLKEQVVIVLHLSYGRREKYLTILKQQVVSSVNLSFVLLEEFMNPDEISKLRLVTDIMIHAPISDALSATMLEVLYAGNKVIAGGWLPYGILSRNHIVYHAFNDFEDLPEKLTQLCEQLPMDEQVVTTNKRNIEKLLFPDRTTADWIRLFKDVVYG